MFRYLAFTLLYFAFPNIVSANSSVPFSVTQALQSVSLTAELDNYMIGDLNNDGIEDLVIVDSDKNKNEVTSNQLLIFIGKLDHPFEIFAQSQKSPAFQRTPEVAINKESLYVSLFRNTLETGDNVSYQFKYIKNGFFLIGEEQHSYSPLYEDDVSATKYDSTTSINYLTGMKIVKNKIDGKTKTIKSKLNAKELNLLEFESYLF